MQQNTVAARSGGRKVPFRLSYILLITIVILSLILSGCTKTQGTAAVPAGKKTVATVSLAGEVQLPAGVSAGGRKVVNGLGSASLDNRSQFKLKAVAGSRQFTVVMSPSGSPMLMGWPGAQNPKINARSTAEVLVYMATGLFTVPGASQRAALEMLDQSNDLDDLEKAISETPAADADALSKCNPRIISALGEAVARISRAAIAASTATAVNLASDSRPGQRWIV